MKPIIKIKIKRVEGPIRRCGISLEFKSFAEASSWLWSQSDTFPANGGYDKHDLTVIFEDGHTYVDILYCKHHTCKDSDLDVHEHLLSSCRWIAGRETRPYCGQEQYKTIIARYGIEQSKLYGNFIDTYLT